MLLGWRVWEWPELNDWGLMIEVQIDIEFEIDRRTQCRITSTSMYLIECFWKSPILWFRILRSRKIMAGVLWCNGIIPSIRFVR